MIRDDEPAKGKVLRCWGKTSRSSDTYHPAVYHMLDVGHVVQQLLSDRASNRWRRVLSGTLGQKENELRISLPFMIALHDVGKVSATFQGLSASQKDRLIAEEFSFGRWRASLDTHHPLVSAACLDKVVPSSGIAMDQTWTIWRNVLVSHHGRFIPLSELNKAPD